MKAKFKFNKIEKKVIRIPILIMLLFYVLIIGLAFGEFLIKYIDNLGEYLSIFSSGEGSLEFRFLVFLVIGWVFIKLLAMALELGADFWEKFK